MAELTRYGAQMETWTAERVGVLLALRTTCCRSWMTWRRAGLWDEERVSLLQNELREVEGRRPVLPR